jgi:N-acetylglucosaminyldiphosphoundecaprenol N-acetyl-beta-D-mannosaminyltransferase
VITEPSNDLSRDVYCLQGIPIDAISMPAAVAGLIAAMEPERRLLLSTPNLNFLMRSQVNATMRESLRRSDLCPPDGVALLWLARLLSLPIRTRVAGSDLFEALVAERGCRSPVKVFFFGGAEGVAAAAARALNARQCGVTCVGWLNPGYGSVDQMSTSEIIDNINASGADFLVVALGAEKGQAWLHQNGSRLKIPVRSHLGATMAFQAGTVRRAPPLVRRLHLEWLWRIGQEPYLWTRYARDGAGFTRLVVVKVLPLVAVGLWQRRRMRSSRAEIHVLEPGDGRAHVCLCGCVSGKQIDELRAEFCKAIHRSKDVVLDLSRVTYIDAQATGLLLMVRKHVLDRGGSLRIAAISPSCRIMLRLQGLGDLSVESNADTVHSAMARVLATSPPVSRTPESLETVLRTRRGG